MSKFPEIITDKPIYLKIYGTNYYLTYDSLPHYEENHNILIDGRLNWPSNYNTGTSAGIHRRQKWLQKKSQKKIFNPGEICFKQDKPTLWVIEEIYEGYYGIHLYNRHKIINSDEDEIVIDWLNPNFKTFKQKKGHVLFKIIKSKDKGLYLNNQSFYIDKEGNVNMPSNKNPNVLHHCFHSQWYYHNIGLEIEEVDKSIIENTKKKQEKIKELHEQIEKISQM